MFLCNPRSANNTFDELCTVILENDADICGITETWYKHDLPAQLVFIPGYALVTKSRVNRIGGGVALYVKHDIYPSQPSNVSVPDDLEVTWIQVRPTRLPRSISCLFCVVIYYPQPDNAVAERLMDHIQSSLDLLTTSHTNAGFIVMGDFNQLDVTPLLYDQRYKQIVHQPTRGTRTLDKIISNISPFYDKLTCCHRLDNLTMRHLLWQPKHYRATPNLTRTRINRPMPTSAICSFGRWASSHDWRSRSY